MAKLTTLQCPRCGAQVEIQPRADRGTCTYCGAVAHVQTAQPVKDAKLPAAASSFRWRPLLIGLALLAFLLVVMMSRRDTSSPADLPAAQPKAALPAQPAPVAQSVAPTPPPAVAPAPVATVQVRGYAPARLVDSDGDKLDELLVPIEEQLGSSTTSRYGVFSTRDGKLLRQTPALEVASDSVLSAVAFGRLVLAQPNGQLTGFDLASGDVQWSTALGERVAALCRADKKTSDALHVVTDDDRNLLLDVKTGRQSETRARCQQPLAVHMGRHAPSDRRDYRAPLEMEAFQCGGVRVMGSQSYSVPDACLARFKVDSDRLPGMVGHALWRMPQGFLVLGVRTPGTYVPMVGVLSRGKWLWKSEVPAQNPLDAQTGGPRLVSLFKDQLLVSYRDNKARSDWVTSFDVRDGRRRWSYAVPGEDQGLVALLQNDDVVVVHGQRGAQLLSPETGAPVASLGGDNK